MKKTIYELKSKDVDIICPHCNKKTSKLNKILQGMINGHSWRIADLDSKNSINFIKYLENDINSLTHFHLWCTKCNKDYGTVSLHFENLLNKDKITKTKINFKKIEVEEVLK